MRTQACSQRASDGKNAFLAFFALFCPFCFFPSFITSQCLRAAEAGHHPSFVRMEEVSIGRPDVNLRRGEGAAAQDLLSDKPFVIVFIEFGFEAGIRDIIRSRPFPYVPDHLMAAVRA